MRPKSTLLFLLALGCGRATTRSDVKQVGVGDNPDEIGPAPTDYGGLVEYDWVNFAGAQLPLALAGLSSYAPVGPLINNFKAPYALVYGVGFVMDQDLPAPDALLGTFAAPPATAGQCQTVYDPTAFVNGLADVGNAISFKSADGGLGVDLKRDPEVYPPDPRNVVSVYFDLEGWRPVAQTRWVPADGSDDPKAMTEEVIRPANFGFGQSVDLSFPGGMPPDAAPVASIPLPLASVGGDSSLTLPSDPQGVRVSWNGPSYDEHGVETSTDGDVSTCLQYAPAASAPADPSGCASLPDLPDNPNDALGQMYTGPWDTENGLLFQWDPPDTGSDTREAVSVTVRFLGHLDPKSEDLMSGYVPMSPTDKASKKWTALQNNGSVPADVSVPDARRPPLACSDQGDTSWSLDPQYTNGDGSWVPSLQGDPLSALVEVTCTLSEERKSSGYAEFTLTPDKLTEAMAYAKLHGAEGAIFYFTRSTATEIATPPVRDGYGKRSDISPLLVVSRAVDLGRFWYDL